MAVQKISMLLSILVGNINKDNLEKEFTGPIISHILLCVQIFGSVDYINLGAII